MILSVSYMCLCCNFFLVALNVWAAVTDIGYRLIPNRIPAMSVAVGLCLSILESHAKQSAITAIFFLTIAGCLWKIGFIGGGDAKFLTALSVGLTATQAVTFILYVACSGGVLALFYELLKRFSHFQSSQLPVGRFSRHVRVEMWRIHRGCPLPYAVAIMFGFVVVKFR